MSYTYLRGASLDLTNLSGADLSFAILNSVQLDQACGTDAKLRLAQPPGLTLEPCPAK